jgi:hypothetical protein
MLLPLFIKADTLNMRKIPIRKDIVRAIEMHETLFWLSATTIARSKSQQEHPSRFSPRATKRICILSYNCDTTKAVRKRNNNGTIERH